MLGGGDSSSHHEAYKHGPESHGGPALPKRSSRSPEKKVRHTL